jgi:DnaJ-class molecular chaperone
MAESKTPCPACGGRGSVSFATEVMDCAMCDGKGTVTSSVAKQAEKDLAQENDGGETKK